MSHELLRVIARHLYTEGITYGEVATLAMKDKLSVEDAMLHLWIANGKDDK